VVRRSLFNQIQCGGAHRSRVLKTLMRRIHALRSAQQTKIAKYKRGPSSGIKQLSPAIVCLSVSLILNLVNPKAKVAESYAQLGQCGKSKIFAPFAPQIGEYRFTGRTGHYPCEITLSQAPSVKTKCQQPPAARHRLAVCRSHALISMKHQNAPSKRRVVREVQQPHWPSTTAMK